MLILQVNNFHFPRGGSDRYFLDITKLLKQEGHKVKTFSALHSSMENTDWLVTEPPKGVDTNKIIGFSNIWNYLYSSDARQQIDEIPNRASLHASANKNSNDVEVCPIVVALPLSFMIH